MAAAVCRHADLAGKHSHQDNHKTPDSKSLRLRWAGATHKRRLRVSDNSPIRRICICPGGAAVSSPERCRVVCGELWGYGCFIEAPSGAPVPAGAPPELGLLLHRYPGLASGGALGKKPLALRARTATAHEGPIVGHPQQLAGSDALDPLRVPGALCARCPHYLCARQ